MTLGDKLFIALLAMEIGMMIQWHGHYTTGYNTSTDALVIAILSVVITALIFK